MTTISKFIEEWGDESKFNKWVFRGQKQSYPVISASVYRDLRILIDNHPYLKEDFIKNVILGWLQEALNSLKE